MLDLSAKAFDRCLSRIIHQFSPFFVSRSWQVSDSFLTDLVWNATKESERGKVKGGRKRKRKKNVK